MKPQIRIVSSPADLFQLFTGRVKQARWFLGFVPKGDAGELIPSWGLHREAAIVLSRPEAERIAAVLEARLYGPL